MQASKHLYIMLSCTSTGMGKVIRRVTRNDYNHVSLTLDETLSNFVSFARYAKGVPLAGGFVRETSERFLSGGEPVPVRICRIPLPGARYTKLNELFALADQKNNLTYNSLGALLSTWHLRFHIPGSYTCLEFASVVLEHPFRSLQELEAYLEPYTIYQGDLRNVTCDNGDRSERYFTRRGLIRGTADTTLHFARLAGRLLRLSRCHDPISKI